MPALIFILFYTAMICAFLYGWIVNLLAVVHFAIAAPALDFTTLIILRIVGIFVGPLGAVLGYF